MGVNLEVLRFVRNVGVLFNMKQILFLIPIFLLFSVMALYPGETQTEDVSNLVDKINSINYTVVNGSNDWFQVNYSGTSIFITPAYFLEPQEYNIDFIINGDVYVSTGNGGGSSKKYYAYECSNWGGCSHGYAYRICEKIQVQKYKATDKPNEWIRCEIVEDKDEPIVLNPDNETEVPEEIEDSDQFEWWKWLIIFLFVGVWFYYFLKYKRERKQENEFNEEEQ